MSQKPAPIVLIVDGEAQFLRVLRDSLEWEGYQVFAVENARDARSLLTSTKVRLIISEAKLEGESGIELFHFVKRVLPKVSFLFMTAHPDVLVETEARELGAQGFLAKPFEIEDFVSEVERLAPLPPPPVVKEEKIQYTQVPSRAFLNATSKTLAFDLYVRLNDSKLVKIVHSGHELDHERIHSYIEKGVTHFYVTTDAYKHYLKRNINVAKMVSVQQGISPKVKAAFLKHTNDLILNYVFFSAIDESAFETAVDLTKTNMEYLLSSPRAFNLLDELNRHSDWLYGHSVGVTIYSSMLASALGWSHQKVMEQLNAAALFHDIGKKNIPRELLEKPEDDLTPDEIDKIRRHPILGMDELKGVPSVTHETLLIVAQHHESPNGTGYPAGLRNKQIYAPAKVVAIADEFCKAVLRSPHQVCKTPEEALEYLSRFRKDRLDPEYLKVFASFIRRRAA